MFFHACISASPSTPQSIPIKMVQLLLTGRDRANMCQQMFWLVVVWLFERRVLHTGALCFTFKRWFMLHPEKNIPCSSSSHCRCGFPGHSWCQNCHSQHLDQSPDGDKIFTVSNLGLVTCIYNLSTWELRREDHCEFWVFLGYITGSRQT